MDAALLARADADCLAVLHAANRFDCVYLSVMSASSRSSAAASVRVPVFVTMLKAVAGDGQAVGSPFKNGCRRCPAAPGAGAT